MERKSKYIRAWQAAAALVLLFVIIFNAAAPAEGGRPLPARDAEGPDPSAVTVAPGSEPEYQRYTITEKRRVEWKAEGGLLIVNEIAGSVYTRPGEKDTLQVRGLKTGYGRSMDDARAEAERIDLAISAPADRIEIATKLPKSYADHPAGFIDYQVHAPAAAQLRLKTVSGEINAAKFDGAVTAESFSGSVKVKSVKGPVSVRTTVGDIEIAGCPETVHAGSVAGGITFEADKLASQTVTLETKSGAVTVRVAEGISATFEVSTVTGKVDTSMARLRATDDREGAKIFKSGKGETTVKIATVSGKITIVTEPAWEEGGRGHPPFERHE
jgi:hypothetical protein